MDWLTFAAHLTQALAWPLTLAVLVLVLRKELRQVAPFVRRVRYGEAEVEFASKLAVAEQRAAQALPPEPEPAAAPLLLPEPSDDVLEVAERLAPISPRAAVTEAWTRVEAAMRQRAHVTVLEPPSSRVRTVSEVARELRRAGKMSAPAFALFDDLRNLRNRAAHVVDPDVTVEQALEYARLARRFLAYLDVALG